ncbi:MAG: esterase-like activity of phytase family protein [Pseudomonadota bacterium]
MRLSLSRTVSTSALALALGTLPALAQEQFPATLAGHAMLPAATFAPAPADAPVYFQTSGRFTGPGNQRDDSLYTREGQTWLSAEGAPRTTGMYLPFVGQPVQGFSGISTLDDGTYLVLTDNGFGSQRNSADTLLMFHQVAPDWDSGRAALLETIFLSDPNHVLPFPIVTEVTDTRYLTGADFDLESIQPVGDWIWFGEEFGPYIFATNQAGEVVAFFQTEVGGEIVHSPDSHHLSAPSAPAHLPFDVRRSRGFEGMAASVDGTMLYPMFEAPLLDPETGEAETQDGVPFVRVLEFDIADQTFTGNEHRVRFDAPNHFVGDFNMISDTHGLYIERDGGEGDPRLACTGEPTVDCFNAPAEYKRVWLLDFGATDADGFVQRLGYVDLLDIADQDGVALHGTIDGVFTFPMVTIEDVDMVDADHIIVANDNNLPYSTGRAHGQADHNEFILLYVPEFLAQIQ